MSQYSRKDFLKASAFMAGGTMMGSFLPSRLAGSGVFSKKVPLYACLWLYASEFPPNWNCKPILDQVFRELSAAGLEGVEVMESNLRDDNAVSHLEHFVHKYNLPVTGSTYYADMWNRSRHQEILDDVKFLTERLHKLGGDTFGVDVGDAGHVKTEAELDAQADLFKQVIKVCDDHKIQANLHNHMYQVVNDMHDLKGTLKRVPDAKLGPDLGWLKRAGVDPVKFIKMYGDRMVYIHIRDLKADGTWAKVVGQGIMNWPAIAKALKNVGFNKSAAIELAFEKAPPRGKNLEKYWAESRKYVHQVFGW